MVTMLAIIGVFHATGASDPTVASTPTTPVTITAAVNTVRTNMPFIFTEHAATTDGLQWQFSSSGGTLKRAVALTPQFATCTNGLVSFVSGGKTRFQLTFTNAAGRAWGAVTEATNVTHNLPFSNIFSSYALDSFNYNLHTNVASRTNGRTMQMWATKPATFAARNTAVRNPLFYLKDAVGYSAVSQCWEGQGSAGQLALTALTRRHVYARGHAFGAADGGGVTNSGVAGQQVAFVSSDGTVVTATLGRKITHWGQVGYGDYSIIELTADLPISIDVMPVIISEYSGYLPYSPTNYPTHQVLMTVPNNALLFVHQDGRVGSTIPGFRTQESGEFPQLFGGDSGSPNMLLIGNELVFYSGRTTTGASAAMQADIDYLCTSDGLNPALYQLTTRTLSAFPLYQ